jgi:hypothetical protein
MMKHFYESKRQAFHHLPYDTRMVMRAKELIVSADAIHPVSSDLFNLNNQKL